MTPTKEQETIIAAVRNSDDNILINALAGTGKTSTLELIQLVSTTKPVLCLAFNKKIAETMTKRFPSTTTVRTFNGCGHRIWQKVVSSISLDAKKMQNLISEEINTHEGEDKKELREAYWEIVSGVNIAKSIGYIPDGKYPNAKRLTDRQGFIQALEERPSPFVLSTIDSLLCESIRLAYKGLIDFNDQVYMPALFSATFPRFPLVLVDEAQDLSPVNHALLDKLAKNRLCAVGDDYQCHPPGTKVRVTGLGEINIEYLANHMEVATYSTRSGKFTGITYQGREIENTNVQQFSGDLIDITVNDRNVKVTPNHKCVVKLNDKMRGHILYLMRKGDRFRIGTTRIRYENLTFGISLRCRQERADAAWLLTVAPDSIDATILEQAYSIKFGVPQTLFYSEADQHKVDSIWEIIGDNLDNGLKILDYFGRDIRYPMWIKNTHNYIGFNKTSLMHACNLVSELMLMLTFPTGAWHPVEVKRIPYTGNVYGITVDATEDGKRTYLANGILVHNSIYGFRGAVIGGMGQLKSRFKMQTQALTVSFRCPKEIVKAVHWRVPEFKWIREGGIVGELKNPTYSSFSDNCAIICRNNAPLFRLAFQLLSNRRSVHVSGSDIGPKIIRLMKKVAQPNDRREAVLIKVESWRQEKLERSQSPGTINDTADCMKIFATFGETLDQAVAYAEHLFAQQGTIKLMTGHKSKGLEFDQVFHLDPWLIGDDEQELNLKYVIGTRAKEAYYEINSKDIT